MAKRPEHEAEGETGPGTAADDYSNYIDEKVAFRMLLERVHDELQEPTEKKPWGPPINHFRDLWRFGARLAKMADLPKEDLVYITKEEYFPLSKPFPAQVLSDLRVAVRKHAEICLRFPSGRDDEAFREATERLFQDFKLRLQSKATPGSAETSIGANILRLRKAAGLTQDQLAERSGVSQAQISQLEKDKWLPRVDALMALAKAMGVPTAALLPPDDTPP